MSKRIGYVRVSTIDQNPERQLEGIELDKKFTDFASGSSANRPQLLTMLEYVRDDDIILVHSMDRLARNVKDLRHLIDSLTSRGIKIQFIKENLIFSGAKDPMANLLLMVMGAIAEFEYSMIRERQREGVQIAKKAGKYVGRKKKLGKEKVEYIKVQLETTRKTKTQIAKEVGVSRPALYNYIKDIETAAANQVINA